MEKESLKAMHLRYLKNKYGRKAEEWESVDRYDDRTVFVNVYRLMIEALNSLPEDPNNYVCVAMNHKMEQDRECLDSIIDVFRTRCY